MKKLFLSLLSCACVSVSVFAAPSVFAAGAGKQWANTDELTLESSGSCILSGYIEDYVVMDNGNILGLFRSADAKKSVRFFLDLSDGSGLKKDSAEVVKENSGTLNKVLLEGLVGNHDGKIEIAAFDLAIER